MMRDRLIPRAAFLFSPQGQALLNNTNESVPIPGGSGVTFDATAWSSRTETSGGCEFAKNGARLS